MSINVNKQRLTSKKQFNNLTNTHKTENNNSKQTIIKWGKKLTTNKTNEICKIKEVKLAINTISKQNN
jgi:hypothetical protein